MKRSADIVISAAGLVVVAPLIVVLVIVIRLTSPGPGILRQTRIGRDARPFTFLKLRSMRAETLTTATHAANRADITPVGRFLRASKLDELPQLWNVLKGEMSLVGPRPCLPLQSELIEARRRRDVLALRPGITGLAQVMGVDMSDPERLAAIDARYAATQSMSTDLRILVATFSRRALKDRTIAPDRQPSD